VAHVSIAVKMRLSGLSSPKLTEIAAEPSGHAGKGWRWLQPEVRCLDAFAPSWYTRGEVWRKEAQAEAISSERMIGLHRLPFFCTVGQTGTAWSGTRVTLGDWRSSTSGGQRFDARC